MNFTEEEEMLMMIYNPGTRLGLIEELEKMKCHLTFEEKHLLDLTENVIRKMKNLTDGDYENIDFYDRLI